MKGITSALELPHDSGHPFVSRRLVGHRAPSTARSTENEEKNEYAEKKGAARISCLEKRVGVGWGGVEVAAPIVILPFEEGLAFP